MIRTTVFRVLIDSFGFSPYSRRHSEMPQPFSRTLRALDADRFATVVVAVCAVLLLLAVWLGWFFLAQVSVYATSQSARLEVNRAVHPVEAPISGRVVAVKVKLE